MSYSSEVENLDVIYISSYLQMSQIPRITLNPLLKGKHKSHPFQQTNELWFSCRFESLLQRDDTIQNNPANSVILWHWNFFHHTDRPLRFAYFMFEVKNTPWKSDTNIKNDGLEMVLLYSFQQIDILHWLKIWLAGLRLVVHAYDEFDTIPAVQDFSHQQ